MSNDKDNKLDLNFLESYKTYAIIFLVAVILIYLFTKIGLNLTISNTGDMGAVGDFFGGILNPIFALIGLFALLRTIQIQTKELTASREELEMTREELSRSASAQEDQSSSIKLQNFENTFFNMINIHDSIVNSIIWKDEKGRHATRQISKYLMNIIHHSGSSINSEERYKRFYTESQTFIGHYFGTVYQVLNFINSSDIRNKERYSSLYKSQFTKPELELLFYYGLGGSTEHKLATLIVEFEFFEFLEHTKEMDSSCIQFYVNLAQKTNHPKKRAFGSNVDWQKCIDKMEQ